MSKRKGNRFPLAEKTDLARLHREFDLFLDFLERRLNLADRVVIADSPEPISIQQIVQQVMAQIPSPVINQTIVNPPPPATPPSMVVGSIAEDLVEDAGTLLDFDFTVEFPAYTFIFFAKLNYADTPPLTVPISFKLNGQDGSPLEVYDVTALEFNHEMTKDEDVVMFTSVVRFDGDQMNYQMEALVEIDPSITDLDASYISMTLIGHTEVIEE